MGDSEGAATAQVVVDNNVTAALGDGLEQILRRVRGAITLSNSNYLRCS